jgi:hypothetical protein
MHELFLAKVSSYWAEWQRTRWGLVKNQAGSGGRIFKRLTSAQCLMTAFFLQFTKRPSLILLEVGQNRGMHNNFPLPSNHSLSFNSSAPISFAFSDPLTVPIDY